MVIQTQQLACGGLAGVQKPGVGLNIVVTATAIEGLVGIFETPLAALAILPIVAGKAYYLQSFCNAPQPADPILTDLDFKAALDLSDFGATGRAGQRINQWLDFMMWPLLCNCADGTAPPPVANTTVPGLGANTGLPGAATGVTCWKATAVFKSATVQVTWFNSLTPKTTDLPGTGFPAGQQPQHLPVPIPTSVSVSVTTHGLIGPAANWAWDLEYLDATGALIPATGIFSPSLNGDRTYAAAGPVPANAAGIQFLATGPVPNQPQFSYDVDLNYYCGTNTPTTPQVPCCPPDPSMDVRLRRIEQFEQIIIGLLGQQLLGHTDGTRHSHLTGNGSVVLVDSVTAVRVEVTSSLTDWDVNPGVPNYYFSLGFITSIAAGSPLKGWRLVYGSQTYPIQPYSDQIGYTLAEGVSIDLVELLPAP